MKYEVIFYKDKVHCTCYALANSEMEARMIVTQHEGKVKFASVKLVKEKEEN